MTHGFIVGDSGDVAFDDCVGNTDEVLGVSEHFHASNEPFGGIVVIPLDTVSVVLSEFVVEVVVAFTEGEDGAEPRIMRGVVFREVLFSAEEGRVGERVDEEGGLVNKEGLGEGSVEVSTNPVAGEETADERRKNDARSKGVVHVVVVLVLDVGIGVVVRDVNVAEDRIVLLHDHPANVRVQETTLGVVGILVSINVVVVDAVITTPPFDGTLESSSSEEAEDLLDGLGGDEGAVGEEAVIADCDTPSVQEVEDDGDDEGGEGERNTIEEGTDGADDGQGDDGGVEPVDLVVTFFPRRIRLGRLFSRKETNTIGIIRTSEHFCFVFDDCDE